MNSQLGHEKLHVYRRGLKFVSWKEALLADIDGQASALDHLDRASESIVEAIANGNSRRSANDRNRFFDVAVGSGLECAACLDVFKSKQLISDERQSEGKILLQNIVRMTIGLRSAKTPYIKEGNASYGADMENQTEILFEHEKLDVYQLGLELIRWLDEFMRNERTTRRYASVLDKTSTSFVLNVAEGNGRYSTVDHTKFLDIAHTSLLKTASGLDILLAKGCVSSEDIGDGKHMIGRLVPLLLGLRGYWDQLGQ